MTIKTVAIDSLRIDGGTQMRTFINHEKVSEYRDAIVDGVKLPPVIAFDDDGTLWLSDGFHRTFAYRAAELTEIEVDVRSGTRRDAWLHSLSANSDHGMPRTNKDKRKALIAALRDREIISAIIAGDMSQRDIAALTGVTQPMVSKVVKELYPRGIDNRYQNAMQIAAAMTDNEKTELIEYRFSGRDHSIHEPKLRNRMIVFGLWNEYGDGGEWTPLTEDVLDLITSGNPDYAVERGLKDLIKSDKGYQFYVHHFGRITPVLNRLIEYNGRYHAWMHYERAESYDDHNWLKILAAAEYVHEHNAGEWSRWYYIAPKGSQYLKLPYRFPVPEFDAERCNAANKEEGERLAAVEKARVAALEAEHGLKVGDIVTTPTGEAKITNVYAERVCTTRKDESGYNQTNWIDTNKVTLVRRASEPVPEPTPAPAPVMTDKEIERQWYRDNLDEDPPGDDSDEDPEDFVEWFQTSLGECFESETVRNVLPSLTIALAVADGKLQPTPDAIASIREHLATLVTFFVELQP